MSIVISLKYKDKCWLACDSQITTGDQKSYLEHNHKIFPVKDREGIIMGAVGFLRGINLLETNNEYIDELTYLKKGVNYEYMVNAFPHGVYNLFLNNGFLSEEEKNSINFKGEMILCTEDKMFEIGWDGSIIERNSVAAVGSGRELALGSLQTSFDPRAEYKEEEIINLLQVAVMAAGLNINCGGTVIIINNQNNEVLHF